MPSLTLRGISAIFMVGIGEYYTSTYTDAAAYHEYPEARRLNVESLGDIALCLWETNAVGI